MGETRKLAAILVSDVVGYSRLAGADEDRILARLRALRSDLIDPTIAVHNGRVVKRTGDGSIVEFRSVVDAVRCAIEVQNAMVERNAGVPQDRRIQFRVGTHLGDVVEESDGDLMGDGVNIAARLEGIAKPGTICLSEDAYRQVKSRLDLKVSDLGATPLKNIAEPVRVYALEVGQSAQAKPAPSATPAAPALALPDKPSIAVLPFANMSADPEQEYFADGMVEDITTALSRIGGLFVIARNSSFTYKGRAVDVRQVGSELGVRYVLEGSVRKAGGQVRITCQLINAQTGAHVWADRFDSNLDDIFGLQDRVTESVAGAIEPTLRNLEIERAANKPTESLDAYDLYLRALSHFDELTRANVDEAVRLLRRAMMLDPRFALAKALTASIFQRSVNLGWYSADGAEAAEGVELARSAVATARDDPETLCRAGYVLSTLGKELSTGRAAIDRAVALNPNSALALNFSAWNRLYAEDWPGARDEFVRALRLSPFDPLKYYMLAGLSVAVGELGQLEEAVDLMHKSFAAGRGAVYGRATLLHHLVRLNRMDEARALVRIILEDDPGYTVAFARRTHQGYSPAFMERRMAAYRAAGIPE
jgi:TolB-like protein/class 3 adenylate cyclase